MTSVDERQTLPMISNMVKQNMHMWISITEKEELIRNHLTQKVP